MYVGTAMHVACDVFSLGDFDTGTYTGRRYSSQSLIAWVLCLGLKLFEPYTHCRGATGVGGGVGGRWKVEARSEPRRVLILRAKGARDR